MTLEAIRFVMEEVPERMVFHIATGDGKQQFTRVVTKKFPVPDFIWKQEVKKFYYDKELKELEVVL